MGPLIGLGLLAVMVLVWIVGRDLNAASKVEQRIKSLQAEGLPYDNASLAEYYKRLSSEQSADQWLKLLKVFDSQTFRASCAAVYPWKDEPPSPDAQLPWPDEVAATDFLTQWSDLRRQAHRLALMDAKVRLPIVFDGTRTTQEATSQIRQLARLLQLESLVAIRQRNSPAALESILCQMGTSKSIEGTPTLVGQLVSMAIRGMAIEQIKNAIEVDLFSARELQALQFRLQARTPWPTLWRIAIHGDRALTLPVFRNPKYYLEGDVNGFWVTLSPWRASGELDYLNTVDKALQLSTDDLGGFTAQARQLAEEMHQARQAQGVLGVIDHSLADLLSPAYAPLAEAFVQSEMQVRLAIVAMGLRQYRKKFNRFPADLEALTEVGLAPEQLMPIGGKPFGYRLENGQVTLWGFRLQSANATPAEPPTADSGSLMDEPWVWTLK